MLGVLIQQDTATVGCFLHSGTLPDIGKRYIRAMLGSKALVTTSKALVSNSFLLLLVRHLLLLGWHLFLIFLAPDNISGQHPHTDTGPAYT